MFPGRDNKGPQRKDNTPLIIIAKRNKKGVDRCDMLL